MKDLVLERFKELYDLTLNDDETLIYVLPKNKWEMLACPLPKNLEGCILITLADYLGLMIDQCMFTNDLKSVTDFVPWSYNEYKAMNMAKLASGEITDLPDDLKVTPDWVTPETENLPISKENFPFLFEEELSLQSQVENAVEETINIPTNIK